MAYKSPLEGRRINIKSNSNSTIDNGTVTLQEGAGISLSQASSTITINRSTSIDFLETYMNNDQTTNLSANDHVKFNLVNASSGSSISLDTTTTYTTTAAAASVGRFTLASGKTYFLFANINCALYSASSGGVTIGWYNATSSAYLGNTTVFYNAPNARSTTQNLSQVPAVAMITTSGSTLVEVRIASAGSLSGFGAIGFGIPGVVASVQRVSP